MTEKQCNRWILNAKFLTKYITYYKTVIKDTSTFNVVVNVKTHLKKHLLKFTIYPKMFVIYYAQSITATRIKKNRLYFLKNLNKCFTLCEVFCEEVQEKDNNAYRVQSSRKVDRYQIKL